MLKSFEVENFRGFQSRLKFDLKAGRYDFNSELESHGLVKNAIVYGPNGIGKSALGLALFDIIIHLTDKKLFEPQQILPYRNLNRAADDVSFKYVFHFDDDELVYEYRKSDPVSLRWERLMVNGERLLECDYAKPKTPFVKEGLVGDLNTQLTDDKLSLVKYIYRNTPTNTVPPITNLVNFCENMLWYRCLSKGNEFVGHESATSLLTDMLRRNSKLDEFTKFLSKFGLSYKLGFESVNNQNILYAYFNGGQKAPFESVASTGTMALYLFYCWSVSAFSNMSLLFIDEFDAFYHFKLSYDICKVLFNLSCQMFLTTHNTTLMTNDLLRPDCYFLIKDNEITPLSGLTEKDLRYGLNLEKLYRGDTFGL